TGPAVRELESGAPEGVGTRGVAAVAPQRPGPAEIENALHGNAPVCDAAGQLYRSGKARPERCADAYSAAHASKPVRPRPAVERHIGGPLRQRGIDPAL